MTVVWQVKLGNTMSKHKEAFYVNAKYIVFSRSDYFKNKYEGLPRFTLECEVSEKLGNNWQELENKIVVDFRNRMFDENKKIEDIKEPILFGKILCEKSIEHFSEIVCGSEIGLNMTVGEVDKLLKFNKIKIIKL